jgi:hypothetical protein
MPTFCKVLEDYHLDLAGCNKWWAGNATNGGKNGFTKTKRAFGF